MKNLLLFVFTLIVIASQFLMVQDVQADSPLFSEVESVRGGKVNSHMIADKPSQVCHEWKDNGWIVELNYYLDGDTPADIAYGDYLQDLSWYYQQYPHTCKIPVESMK